MSVAFKGNRVRDYIGNVDSVILLCFLGYGFVSQSLFLCVVAGITFITILNKLWKPYAPPVLLFFVLMHWLQVFGSILLADFRGKTIDEMFAGTDTEFLIAITFLQILAVSLVLNRYLKRKTRITVNFDVLRDAANKLNTRKVIIGYFIGLLFLPLLYKATEQNSALFQLTLSFGILKTIFTCLLIFILLLKKDTNRKILIGILVLDFILSFASFFSDFKTLLFMVVIAYFTVFPYLKRRTIYSMIPVLFISIVFFSFWSYVKGDYREFLNQGEAKQVVKVSNSQALSFIFDRASDISVQSIIDGASIFLARVQYMQRYAEVYARVPSIIEHTDGDELGKTIEFLVIPRFLNADKGVKDASQRTSYYTGKQFTNAAQGTSISMGYFCDLYIDFGLYLMFLPLIIIFSLIGMLYEKLVTQKRYNILFSYGILIGVFLNLGSFESDSLFFLGIIRNTVVFIILAHYAIFPFLHKYIVSKK